MAASLLNWLLERFGLARRQQGASPFPPGQGPARLLILRHAEKTGDKRDRSLSPAGWARAEKLATYIPKTFGKPDFLIAAASGKKSDRPHDTLVPLAKALSLPIHDDLDDEDVEAQIEALAQTPQWRGKLGVVSWRHSDLPHLIAALGAPDGSYPDPWGEALYDPIIEMRFTGNVPQVRLVKQPF